MPKIRNIIIFVSIAAVFVLIYIFFVQKPEAPDTNLVTSSPSSNLPDVGGTNAVGALDNTQNLVAQEFLTLLLSVRNIKLDDSIFADTAWNSLRDSSIVLVPDGTEGRPNPFAPIGSDKEEVSLDPLLTNLPTEPSPPTAPPSTNNPPVNYFNDPLSITSVTPLTGPVGTVVTINGSGFSQSGNKVSFKSSPIQNINSTDGSSIVFTVPSSVTPLGLTKPEAVKQGVYSFFVTNSKGKSTSSWQFTVTP
ncbi:MAG: IPT/TIG domain-containing protein [Minisyncoccia bacterium]